MGKRDELIAKYADDLKTKCKVTPDMALLTKVTIGCGPAIYNADAATVAASQPAELETVKNNFLIKKLGLKDGPELIGGDQRRDRNLRQIRAQQVSRGGLLPARQAFRQGKGLRLAWSALSASPDQLLDRPGQTSARGAGIGRQRRRSFCQRLGRHDPVDQAPGQRLIGLDLLPRHQNHLGPRRADQRRQPCRV